MIDQDEVRRRQKSRAMIMGGLLMALVVLIYGISIAKMVVAP
jgi:accessory gene regulator protein AgrB